MRNASVLITSLGIHPDLFDRKIPSWFEKRDLNYITPQDDWHREELETGPYRFVIVWANIHPTELRLPSGEIVIPACDELVLFDNIRVYHRPPRRTGDNLMGRRFIIAKIS